jgi:signal transduction histidine kinase
MSKSLSIAVERLEHLTEQLEHARRSAEQARELKTQFAVAISHELRTPLNLVIGFSEMMILSPESSYGEPLPESYRGDLEAVYCNACHISNLIDDVLDLSQVDAHRLALQKEWTAPATVIEEAVTAIATMVRDKRLHLGLEVPAELPRLYADPVRLRQVLINLLVNAIRFTDRGGITVSARSTADDVVIAIRDTGVGIAPDNLPRLFQDFRQVSQVGRKYGGSGVGLSCQLECSLPGGSLEDTVGGPLQVAAEEAGDTRVVVDHQHGRILAGGKPDPSQAFGRAVRQLNRATFQANQPDRGLQE